jgi:hypothetical protein
MSAPGGTHAASSFKEKGGAMESAMRKEDGFSLVRITMDFDRAMQLIVGSPSIDSIVDEGCPFWFVFRNLLADYPEIWNRYPPGTLGFTLNGVAPELETPLADGDRITFFVEQEAPQLFS